jgi:predicted oxidoreductase (fatty acid repression mutant protein)
VSEYSEDINITVKDIMTNETYSFNLESGRAVLFAVNREGRVVKSYRDIKVM